MLFLHTSYRSLIKLNYGHREKRKKITLDNEYKN